MEDSPVDNEFAFPFGTILGLEAHLCQVNVVLFLFDYEVTEQHLNDESARTFLFLGLGLRSFNADLAGDRADSTVILSVVSYFSPSSLMELA